MYLPSDMVPDPQQRHHSMTVYGGVTLQWQRHGHAMAGMQWRRAEEAWPPPPSACIQYCP